MLTNGRRTTHHGNREGFTLIELLVVIMIIGVLVGILIPAIQQARTVAKRAQASGDINNIVVGIGNFTSTYTCPPPPTSAANTTDYNAYLKRVWPRLTAAAQTPTDGNKSIQFFLGGPSGTGFLESSTDPFNGAGKRTLFMDFPSNKMKGGYFVDPWDRPYFYMASYNGNDYSTWGACITSPFTLPSGEPIPGFTVSPFTDPSGRFINQNGFQVISAGPNKNPGPGGVWTPGAGAYGGGAGYDDIANFYDKPLGAR